MTSIWTSDLELVPPILLGVQLLPLQLGHPRVLRLVDSPLLVEGRSVAAGDVALAAWICSISANQAAQAVRGAKADDFYAWAKSLPTDTDYSAALATFNEYFANYMRAPEAWEAGPVRKMGSPWWERVHFALVHYGRRDALAAWEVPMPEAIRCYCVAGEMIGGARLVSEEEQAEIENLPEPRLIAEPPVAGDPDAAQIQPQEPEEAHHG